jgi:hypothetical protein
MRALLALVLCLLPGLGAAGDLDELFEEELEVPIRLERGGTLTLRAVHLVGEDLGRRLVLRADFDGVAEEAADPAAEEAAALEICHAHLPELIAHLEEQPWRRITHLEVIYRATRTHFGVDVHDRRGLRIDTGRHGCTGA